MVRWSVISVAGRTLDAESARQDQARGDGAASSGCVTKAARVSLAALYEVVQGWQGRLASAPAVDAFVASGYNDSDSIDMAELRRRRR